MTGFKQGDRVEATEHYSGDTDGDLLQGTIRYVFRDAVRVVVEWDDGPEEQVDVEGLRLLPPRIMPEQITPVRGDVYHWRPLFPADGEGRYTFGWSSLRSAELAMMSYDAAVGAVKFEPERNPDGSVKVVWRDEVKS